MTTFRLGPKSKPAELLAALGEKLSTYQDRDNIYIPARRKLVPHGTARRDYVCSCGSRLLTRNVNGRWVTVCAAHPEHEQARFISQGAYALLQAQQEVSDA